MKRKVNPNKMFAISNVNQLSKANLNEKAKDVFSHWTKAKINQEFGTMEKSLIDFAETVVQLFMYGIMNGDSMYLNNDEFKTAVEQWLLYQQHIPDIGVPMVFKYKHIMWNLFQLLRSYNWFMAPENADALKDIEAKIKECTNGKYKKLRAFYEGLCISYTNNYIFFVGFQQFFSSLPIFDVFFIALQ